MNLIPGNKTILLLLSLVVAMLLKQAYLVVHGLPIALVCCHNAHLLLLYPSDATVRH